MATVVIPFRSSDPKRRLDGLEAASRADLAHAMLADVLAAAIPLGPVFVVAPEAPGLPPGVEWVDDPHSGQGAAVRAALDAATAAGSPPPFLVVNADLPCVTTRDLLALAAAPDGTTNALALAAADLFRPLYGEGSAERFAKLAPSRRLDAPNLMDDVDTPGDLARLAERLGTNTKRVLASLHLESAA